MDLEVRKKEFEALRQSIYARRRDMRAKVKTDPAKVALVQQLALDSEDYAAAAYDVDRCTENIKYCRPDERGKTQKATYEKLVAGCKERMEVLGPKIEALEAQLATESDTDSVSVEAQEPE